MCHLLNGLPYEIIIPNIHLIQNKYSVGIEMFYKISVHILKNYYFTIVPKRYTQYSKKLNEIIKFDEYFKLQFFFYFL